MKPLQIEGSPDEEDLVWVQNILRKMGVPQSQIIRNGYLFYHDEGNQFFYSRTGGTPPNWGNWSESSNRWIIHHPDVMMVNKNGTLKLIIEIDGSAHDDRPGSRRTYKRDQHYEEMKIPHFVKINKGEEKDWHQALIDSLLELEQLTDAFD